MKASAVSRETSLADAEWNVMDVVWDNPGLTANEIIPLVAPSSRFSTNPGTVKTYLTRLVKKGFVSVEKDGREFRYTATKSREHFIKAEIDDLIGKLPTRKVASALSHFVDQAPLDVDGRDEWEKVIDSLKGRLGSDR